MDTRVALAQINVVVGDISTNTEKIIEHIYRAKDYKCDIVVFPELAVCGYPPEDLLMRKSFLDRCHEAVKEISQHVSHITALVGSPWLFGWGDHRRAFNHNGKELFNSAVLMANRGIQDIYFKTELPNYGVFDEKRYFSRLDDPECLIFVMNGLRFNITICEDIWIWPSPVQRLAGMNDVDVTLNLSASPFYAGKLEEARHQALQNFCTHTGSSLVYTNLVGGQDELVFDGTSVVMDANGHVHHMANRFEEDFLVVDLNEAFSRKREQAYPFRDYYPTTSAIERTFAAKLEPCPESNRTIGIHESNTAEFLSWLEDRHIEEIYFVIVLGLRDYVRKNGFQKVVIGESGGIDSAVVTALAVAALGSENVIAVTMPSLITSDETKGDAILLAENFGILCETIPIQPTFVEYHNALRNMEAWNRKDKTHSLKEVVSENLQARIRGNILMALSNEFGWLVLSTGNKSETAVGYCTLYGDMAGGFSPIKDVPKTKIWELAELINEIRIVDGLLGIPESIIKRPPTAELSVGQSDEKALGPYDYVDQVVESYVEQGSPRSEIIANFRSLVFPAMEDPAANAVKIMDLIDRNEYKRRQGPPGVKITPVAFGKDRRMPITNRFHG
jgi:NAD+ synthase (glutamine-hydrolysing)